MAHTHTVWTHFDTHIYTSTKSYVYSIYNWTSLYFVRFSSFLYIFFLYFVFFSFVLFLPFCFYVYPSFRAISLCFSLLSPSLPFFVGYLMDMVKFTYHVHGLFDRCPMLLVTLANGFHYLFKVSRRAVEALTTRGQQSVDNQAPSITGEFVVRFYSIVFSSQRFIRAAQRQMRLRRRALKLFYLFTLACCTMYERMAVANYTLGHTQMSLKKWRHRATLL